MTVTLQQELTGGGGTVTGGLYHSQTIPGVYINNNNTNSSYPKDNSYAIFDEIIRHFIAPVTPYVLNANVNSTVNGFPANATISALDSSANTITLVLPTGAATPTLSGSVQMTINNVICTGTFTTGSLVVTQLQPSVQYVKNQWFIPLTDCQTTQTSTIQNRSQFITNILMTASFVDPLVCNAIPTLAAHAPASPTTAALQAQASEITAATFGIVDTKGNGISQDWRLFFLSDDRNGQLNAARVYWGTTTQLTESLFTGSGSSTQLHSTGVLTQYQYITNQLLANNVPYVELWDENTNPTPGQTYINYAMTIVQRGFALSMWRNYESNSDYPGWTINSTPGQTTETSGSPGDVLLCIQRPVLPTAASDQQPAGMIKYPQNSLGQIFPVVLVNGTQNPPNPNITPSPPFLGNLPIFALSFEGGLAPGQEGNVSVVRERDINASSPKRQISTSGIVTIDGAETIQYYTLYGLNLNWSHPNILSNNTHVIKVPFGLCTDRHIYPEEMDLIAFTQATCFITYQTADITMYGSDRRYTGTWGQVKYNYDPNDGSKQILGGTRICLLSGSSFNQSSPL